jgi:hypothetical protein
MTRLLTEKTEALAASPKTLRSLGSTLRQNGFNYSIERVKWTNFNRAWKGHRGLVIRVSNSGYCSLFTGLKCQ